MENARNHAHTSIKIRWAPVTGHTHYHIHGQYSLVFVGMPCSEIAQCARIPCPWLPGSAYALGTVLSWPTRRTQRACWKRTATDGVERLGEKVEPLALELQNFRKYKTNLRTPRSPRLHREIIHKPVRHSCTTKTLAFDNRTTVWACRKNVWGHVATWLTFALLLHGAAHFAKAHNIIILREVYKTHTPNTHMCRVMCRVWQVQCYAQSSEQNAPSILKGILKGDLTFQPNVR